MATDIDQSHYNTGTATVAGTAVTGQGTTWLGTIRKGDLFGTHKGSGVRIASVNSNTSLTLAYAVTSLNQTAAAYEIQRTPFDVGYLAAIEDMIRLYGVGNLPSLAGLDGAGGDKLVGLTGAGEAAAINAKLLLALNALDGTGGDKGVLLTGAGTGATFPLTPFARTLLDDADAAAARETLGANDAANLSAGLLNVARIPANLTPDKAFRRGNVIGSVSQSGGVPSGAIIERGSNANGEYVRFADGTQECWGVNTLGSTSIISPDAGGGFRSGPLSATLPAPFSSATLPVHLVAALVTGTGVTAYPEGRGNAAIGYRLQSIGSYTSASATIVFYSKGRWF